MESKLLHINIKKFNTENNGYFKSIPLSYQVFGQTLGSAPVVLINHALTGNSNVTGDDGWWKALVGFDKLINLNNYTVLAFNVPGNGYDGYLVTDYKAFTIRDIASLFIKGLKALNISKLFAIIGGSIGGGIAWEMVSISPSITQTLIPIACDWKATDWMIANTKVQEQILNNSIDPVHDARMHAMLCYRTPESFNEKFNRTTHPNQKIFNVESWLIHHGKILKSRYQLAAYKLMNHLLGTLDITKGRGNFLDVVSQIEAKIVLIGINSDLFFKSSENKDTYKWLKIIGKDVYYQEIKSIHGHDAFLIEFDQLNTLLADIFISSSVQKQFA